MGTGRERRKGGRRREGGGSRKRGGKGEEEKCSQVKSLEGSFEPKMGQVQFACSIWLLRILLLLLSSLYK